MTMTIWILGAPDPEMEAIEKLLRGAGQRVEYMLDATGNRVHPGSAYRIGETHFETHCDVLGDDDEIVLVECDARLYGRVSRIDHHREGDQGYGRPPAEFFAASSIGQVFLHLHRSYEQIEPEHLLVAAADHCLAAAYRGECPGVDPDALMRWRVESRARFQGRDPETLLADVEATRERLRVLARPPVPGCGPGWANDHDPRCPAVTGEPGACLGAPPEVIVVDEHLPELPEAAARGGYAVQSAGLADRDGRRKIVLTGCCPPDVVERWMRDQRARGREVYGDPARGFAGAYLTEAT